MFKIFVFFGNIMIFEKFLEFLGIFMIFGSISGIFVFFGVIGKSCVWPPPSATLKNLGFLRYFEDI
jgi:hypothetical protein